MKENRMLSTLKKSHDLFGQTIRYVGSLPDDSLIFISGGGTTSSYGLKSVFRSTLEALANGYAVGYVPGTRYAEIVEEASDRLGEGKLFAFSAKGLETLSRTVLSRCLLTGGGVLTLNDDEEFFSIERLREIKELASVMAKVVVLSEENSPYIPFVATNTLDNGRELVLLRSALQSRGCRFLLSEGCPVVETFSDFLMDSRYITYPTDSGKYGIEGASFDIIDSRYGKRRV